MMVVERMAGHDIERRWVGGERWDGGCEGGGGGKRASEAGFGDGKREGESRWRGWMLRRNYLSLD